jgi:hypothetical protein
MEFVQWMRANGLSESSADKYAGAINGRLTAWARQHGLTPNSLAEIRDLPVFEAVAEGVKQTPEFQRWNATGNHMYSAALRHYNKFLHTFGPGFTGNDTVSAGQGKGLEYGMLPREYGPHSRKVKEIESADEAEFNPVGQNDARERVLREIVRRRGQRKFRSSLIAAYGGRCAITGCAVLPLLEAAHITPYLGPETNSITNGLLLRADIHTLWDLGLLAIDVVTQTVWVSPKVVDPAYQSMSGGAVLKPSDPNAQPSLAALRQQWLATRTLAQV